MQDILIVVDMQNDFIDGSLGTKEAVEIVPKVAEKIRNFKGRVLFTRVVDMTLILRRLGDLGYDSITATAMFGSYSTMAVPICHLPSSLIAGVSVSLVPGLTDAVESGCRERAIQNYSKDKKDSTKYYSAKLTR